MIIRSSADRYNKENECIPCDPEKHTQASSGQGQHKGLPALGGAVISAAKHMPGRDTGLEVFLRPRSFQGTSPETGSVPLNRNFPFIYSSFQFKEQLHGSKDQERLSRFGFVVEASCLTQMQLAGMGPSQAHQGHGTARPGRK